MLDNETSYTCAHYLRGPYAFLLFLSSYCTSFCLHKQCFVIIKKREIVSPKGQRIILMMTKPLFSANGFMEFVLQNKISKDSIRP